MEKFEIDSGIYVDKVSKTLAKLSKNTTLDLVVKLRKKDKDKSGVERITPIVTYLASDTKGGDIQESLIYNSRDFLVLNHRYYIEEEERYTTNSLYFNFKLIAKLLMSIDIQLDHLQNEKYFKRQYNYENQLEYVPTKALENEVDYITSRFLALSDKWCILQPGARYFEAEDMYVRGVYLMTSSQSYDFIDIDTLKGLRHLIANLDLTTACLSLLSLVRIPETNNKKSISNSTTDILTEHLSDPIAYEKLRSKFNMMDYSSLLTMSQELNIDLTDIIDIDHEKTTSNLNKFFVWLNNLNDVKNNELRKDILTYMDQLL